MLKLSFLKNFNFDPRLDPEVEFLDRKLQAEIDLATHHVTQEGFFFLIDFLSLTLSGHL